MPREGHQPRRSERDQPILRTEAMVRAPRPSRVTLPYFTMADDRRSRMAGLRREVASELAPTGMAPESAVEAPLPDAAVGSMGNPMVLEVVIGNDDRVKVTAGDMRRNPFRQIAALRIQAATGTMYVGTGWYIGPRALATAGHCVYLHKDGGWPASIEVIPAKFGSVEPYRRLTAKRFRAVDGWTEHAREDLDYGVLLLDDETAGTRVGWFEVDVEPTGALEQTVANISGYPADRDSANFQYFHARQLTKVTDTRLAYEIDTFGGQSGSPIWIDTNQGVVAIGVHTTGAATGNSGTRVNDDVIVNLISWRDE